MKLFIFAVLFFYSDCCFSQNYSLNDISKIIVKAFNDSNFSKLEKISLTYEDFKQLQNNYVTTKDSSKRDKARSEMINVGFDFYDNKMKMMLKTFRFYSQYFYNGRPKKFATIKYLSYEYNIHTSPTLFSKIAEINIRCIRDTHWVVIENLVCYKTLKGWKLAGINNFRGVSVRNISDQPQYLDWHEKYDKIRIEAFPYKCVQDLWNQLTEEKIKDSNNSLLLTKPEFTIYYDYSNKYNSYSEDIDQAYKSYLNGTYRSLKMLHDSIMKYIPFRKFDQSFVVGQRIKNSPGALEMSDYGKGFRLDFWFNFPQERNGKRRKYGFSYPTTFIQGKKKGEYKILLAIPSFYESHRESNGQYEPYFPLQHFDYGNL